MIGVGPLHGSSLARVAGTISEGLSVIGSTFLAIAYPADAIIELFSIVITLIIFTLVWMRRANVFFRRLR